MTGDYSYGDVKKPIEHDRPLLYRQDACGIRTGRFRMRERLPGIQD